MHEDLLRIAIHHDETEPPCGVVPLNRPHLLHARLRGVSVSSRSKALPQRRGRSCGAAIDADDFGDLRTSLPGSHPKFERLTRPQGADGDACERRRMEESVARSIRALDEAIPLLRAVPFHLAPNCRRGWFVELRSGSLLWGLGSFAGLPRIIVLEDLLASLMEVSSSFENEVPYGFEHGCPPGPLSLAAPGREVNHERGRVTPDLGRSYPRLAPSSGHARHLLSAARPSHGGTVDRAEHQTPRPLQVHGLGGHWGRLELEWRGTWCRGVECMACGKSRDARSASGRSARARFEWIRPFAVDLRGADLRATKLNGANLSRARLEGANLFKAVLDDADLSGAFLYGAQFLNCAQLVVTRNWQSALRGEELACGAAIPDAKPAG